MEWIADPTIWAGLTTLIVLEVVLGIDNLVFIAILADKLPPHQRDKARLLGLSLALIMRLLLLASISWLVTLTTPLFSVFGWPFSGRDLIMLVGGLFLLTKAVMELHERLEPPHESTSGPKVHASFWVVVTQIIVLDAVFSLDSVITAVGMVDSLPVMMAAVIIAILVMMIASKPLMTFVGAHPTVVVLCLGFLMMIGFSLVAEGLGFHIPKGYLYAAIGFSILIEFFNQVMQRNSKRRVEAGPLRQRTAEAVFRLLGGRVEEEALATNGGAAPMADEHVFGAEERVMVSGVLTLGERQVSSIMTPRPEIIWISLAAEPEKTLEILRHSSHSLYPVCRDTTDDLVGYARAKNLMEDLLSEGRINEERSIQSPLVVHEGLGVLKLMEMFRTSHAPIAFVTDEYGSIEGLITPADILEAIAGEFPEDAEDNQPWLEKLEDGRWRVEGWADVRRLSFEIGRPLEMSGDDFSTIAGYVMWYLGRVPELGDNVEHDGLIFTVTGMEGRRITSVEIAEPPAEAG